jgi:ferredoxin
MTARSSDPRAEVVADRNRCVGSGNCLLRLPDVFSSDEEEGLVEVLDATGAGHRLDDLQDAAEACPAQAIRVVLT